MVEHDNDMINEKSFKEMIAEANAGEISGGRKLTFAAQCSAFAALYGGVKNFIVARAFGISIQATSYLSGCLESDPDPYRHEYDTKTDTYGDKILMDHNRNRSPNRIRRYQDVAREFEALGKDEFNARYYTPRVHDRIIAAKHELRAERKNRKPA